MMESRPLLRQLGTILEMREAVRAEQERRETAQDAALLAAGFLPVVSTIATAIDGLRLVKQLNDMRKPAEGAATCFVYSARLKRSRDAEAPKSRTSSEQTTNLPPTP